MEIYLSKSCKNKIDGITDDWWKESNKKAFYSYAKKLIRKGFSEDDAIDFLSDIYSVVSSEYSYRRYC